MYEVLISWKDWLSQPTISNGGVDAAPLPSPSVSTPLVLPISYLSYATPKGSSFST